MKQTLSKLKLFGYCALATALVFSCKKKEDPQPEVVVDPPAPTLSAVYSADSLNYLEASQRMAMFTELINITKQGNTVGKFVDSTVLRNMFYNTGSPFANATLNTSTVKLSEAVDPSTHALLLSYFQQLSEASKSQTKGGKDTAGVIISEEATSGKLYDTKGYAVYELIEKNLMGGFQVYNIGTVHLSDANLNSTDNTARLKNWDMAFGYLGVPRNYTATTPSTPAFPLAYWASYLKTNDATLGGNIKNIMTAFVSGRKAIEANNNTEVKANARIIKEELDRTGAGMAMTYLFRARKAMLNQYKGRRNGALSEGRGFLDAMKFNPSRKITDAEWNEVISYLGTNNWDTSLADVEKALDKLGLVYGFDSNVTTSKFNK